MSLPEAASLVANRAKNDKTIVIVCALFLCLFFDPRITYMQRDITAVAARQNQMDTDGTRHDQQDIGHLSDQVTINTSDIKELKAQGAEQKNLLTAILQKVSR